MSTFVQRSHLYVYICCTTNHSFNRSYVLSPNKYEQDCMCLHFGSSVTPWIVYWIFETHPTHPSNIVVVYVLRMIKPCDLDKGDDMNHCVDSRMPVMTHEICANVAYTAVVPTCFFILMFPSHSVIFVEERFMCIGADSRDFVTKK